MGQSTAFHFGLPPGLFHSSLPSIASCQGLRYNIACTGSSSSPTVTTACASTFEHPHHVRNSSPGDRARCADNSEFLLCKFSPLLIGWLNLY